MIMKAEIYNDHFQNFKRYQIPKAQLIIADIPYNLGVNAYASNPAWYKDGDNSNGESELAGKEFFDTDKDFKPAEFMHFASQLLRPEPKEKGAAPCMIVFCAFDQQMYLIELKVKSPFKKDGTLLKNDHLEGQQKAIDKLNKLGYYATFGVGFEHCKQIIDDYLSHVLR